MKKVCFLFIAMMFLSTNAMAETPQWLYDAIKKDNPSQLAYWAKAGSNCPFTDETMSNIVEGVFIRSRIKPLKEDILVSGRIYLDLDIHCVPVPSNNPVYVISVHFARYEPVPKILLNYGFFYMGIGPADSIKRQTKIIIEEAVTVYIKANFNL